MLTISCNVLLNVLNHQDKHFTMKNTTHIYRIKNILSISEGGGGMSNL